MEANINALESWSKKLNLVVNTDKTKTILFSTRQMAQNTILIIQNYTPSSRKTPSFQEKLLGKFWEQKYNPNCSWQDQITTLITEGYSTLKTLKKNQTSNTISCAKDAC